MQQEREGGKEEENDLDPRPTSSFISRLYLSRSIHLVYISVAPPPTRLFALLLLPLHFASVISLCSPLLARSPPYIYLRSTAIS